MAFDGGYVGGKLFDSTSSSSGGAATIYSSLIDVRNGDVWSMHLTWTETAATYAAAVTLWASNKPEPSLADDTDWVQMTADHGWDGLPGGDPTSGSGKDLVDISGSGARKYRLKIVRSTGTATINGWYVQKSRG